MKKLDKDTQKILNNQGKLHDFVQTDAWANVIRPKFIEKIRANSSLLNILVKPASNDQELARELVGRAHAATLLLEILSEIEGDAKQYPENLKLLTQAEEETIVMQLPGSQ